MTRGKRVNPEFLEATSLADAIAKLEALKRERAQAGAAGVQEAAAGTGATGKRGRPAKVKANEPQPSPVATSPVTSSPVTSSPVTSSPGKRGRTPKEGQAAPAASFGVGKLTAHRPLGLLEVQESTDLDALLADPRLAGQIAMRLDDRFALVLPASLERLQAALLKAGHTPKLSGKERA
ncbi:hypothetical protein Q0M94_05095 [Deinococcus radiomollis]|uniref:hypothetical protein n=1 Tax=Deinococcus radiomollis TaxID=468916 RepID=UPI003892B30B